MHHEIELVEELLKIPGTSGREAAVSFFVEQQLLNTGLPASAITHDTANRRSAIGGEIGNLIVKLPGTQRGPRRLLMAHLDTVPLCEGTKPKREGNRIIPSDPTTALGADDRAGVAVVLSTALKLLSGQYSHPPLTLLFCVQEEVGLRGCRHLTKSALGNPALCFNFDGRQPHVLTIGATGDVAMTIEIDGIPSHAGVHPEQGVNAAVVAAMAIQALNENGWHGLIQKGSSSGTSNIGVIQGGNATNVVMPSVKVVAEARSHQPKFRERIVREFRNAFEAAAKQLTNHEGRSATVRFSTELKYDAFRLKKSEPVVQAAEIAVRNAGFEPEYIIGNGGLDANWMTAHGFPTVTFGCGQHNIHTVDEWLDLDEYSTACEIALDLATDGQSAARS
ncbi:M20/M25/M40 family metallo-hydrolase [Calycomorphotria hydatis]|uniref:Carboxypeptidase G2 n=1 Tax=Calycomorphotria hydatis TaxID=2528027 RepID=A0A517TD12_9PLAN|nr:M20/M25/M40 family metallo-hydrolase [Calycomorphotria hydatis]QDT66265.1 Carboxypeptidase G2 precursor [Calycomorphotria hydatis]